MNTEEKNKTKQNKRQVVGVLKNVMREDRKGREGSLAAIARGTPYTYICMLKRNYRCIPVARTKQHEEEEEDTGIRPKSGGEVNKGAKRKKEKDDSKSRYCRFRAPPIELNENKQSRNYHSL